MLPRSTRNRAHATGGAPGRLPAGLAGPVQQLLRQHDRRAVRSRRGRAGRRRSARCRSRHGRPTTRVHGPVCRHVPQRTWRRHHRRVDRWSYATGCRGTRWRNRPRSEARSSATIGRTRSFFAARTVTWVGSQPVFATPTSTCHVPSPRAVAARCLISRQGDASAWNTANSACFSTSACNRWPGGLVHEYRSFQPPSSTGPSWGWSYGYQSTNPASRSPASPGHPFDARCRSSHRSTASASSAVGPTYQKCVDCFVPVAAWTMSQNSVVHAYTPRCS